MNEVVEYVSEAKNRIEICKTIMGHIQKRTSRLNEEWHIYTFRQDKGIENPVRFKICNTKRKNFILATAIVPVKNLLNIYFNESKKVGGCSILTIEFITKKFNIQSSGLDLVDVIGGEKEIKKLLNIFLMNDWKINIIEKK